MYQYRLLVFLGFFLSFTAQAQLLENYDGAWNTASEESWLSSNDQIELEVDLTTFPESELQIQLPSQSTVFVNGRLWILTNRDTVIYTRTEELRKEFGTDRANFTVVSSNLAPFNTGIRKVLGRMDSILTSTEPDETLAQTRFVYQPIRDFYFSALFLILIFLALYKLAYPYLLAVMVQPLSVINAEDFSESGNLQKFFSFDILFYILIVAMILSLGTLTGLIIYQREWLQTWIGLDYLSLLAVWLAGSLAILVLTVLKFIGIRVLSYLFDLGKAEFSHFFYLLRLIVFGTTVMILIGAYFMSNDYSALESVFGRLVQGFFWFYILGVAGLFLIMMSKLSFKKYHLFTYLCIAELVPFLILAKWIMVLGQ
jgi:hypothetical protein